MEREALQDIKNFDAFLLAISRNLAINAFRKAMREIRRKDGIYQNLAEEEEETPEEEQLLYNRGLCMNRVLVFSSCSCLFFWVGYQNLVYCSFHTMNINKIAIQNTGAKPLMKFYRAKVYGVA